MPYLGNEPAVAYTSTTKDSFSGDGSTTDFTMSKSANVNAVRVVVENVVQNPTVAYTCSGTTISFTSAPPTGTSNIYVVHLGPPAATVAPPTTINNATTYTADLTIDDGADIITGSKGTDNVRLGEGAGTSIESGGDNNVTIGKDAGTAITTGDRNTAVGKDALKSMTTGSFSTAVGYQALENNTGNNNTAVGDQALEANTSGINNTAVGDDALVANTTGANNVGLGGSSLDANTTGDNNTGLGTNALSANTTAEANVAVGTNALIANTTGAYNVAVGMKSLNANTTAPDNTAVGYESAKSNTTGTDIVAVGAHTLESNTTGTGNVAIGRYTMAANTTGTGNTAVGAYDGVNAYQPALRYNTTGANNVAIGAGSLAANTTASFNTAVGSAAGTAVTTGTNNTFVGRQAGLAVNTGSSNTYVGPGAMGTATTGSSNTVIGGFNGNQDGLDIRTSDGNIVLSNGLGEYHIWIDTSGAKMMRGDGITAAQVGNGAATGSYFGNAADFYSCRATNSTSVHTRWYNSNGQVGRIETTGTQTNYVTSSDYRLKENVTYNWDATTRLKQLKPARFNFIADADTTVDGFLAHEAGTVVPEAVSGVKDGVEVWNEADDLPDGISVGDNKLDVDGNTVPEYQGIDHSRLVPLLTAALQEAIAKIETLETKVAALEAG